VSLLLDALKRAEQEKLARNSDRQAEPPPREELPRPAPPPSNASLELAPLTSAPVPPSGARADAAAAQTMFKAKAPPAQASGKKRGAMYALITLGAILLIAACAYVWYSVNSLLPPVATAQRPRSPMQLGPPPAASTTTFVPQPPPAVQAGASPPFVPMSVPPPRQPQEAIPGPTPAPAVAAVTPVPRAATGSPSENALANLMRDSSPSSDSSPLQLSRSAERPRPSSQVVVGYEALRNGDLDGARRAYTAAVATDGMSVDAQLGLATVEARSGNRGPASQRYRRALELDSRNATALAGLAALADFSRPEALESQLRGDLAKFPQSSALHFTLGNLLATQLRWSEAQNEFFEAHRLDPGNADIVYNLAVSLDHLGQTRPAAEFYRRALETARGQVTQFDPGLVARRLAELRP
jgi:Tfp pilus assembly protein PilF